MTDHKYYDPIHKNDFDSVIKIPVLFNTQSLWVLDNS
jgi:hypothetical protein